MITCVTYAVYMQFLKQNAIEQMVGSQLMSLYNYNLQPEALVAY